MHGGGVEVVFQKALMTNHKLKNSSCFRSYPARQTSARVTRNVNQWLHYQIPLHWRFKNRDIYHAITMHIRIIIASIPFHPIPSSIPVPFDATNRLIANHEITLTLRIVLLGPSPVIVTNPSCSNVLKASANSVPSTCALPCSLILLYASAYLATSPSLVM
jgi:hypothetical protein